MSYTLKENLNFFDFQSAEPQQEFELIPKGVIARVNMKLRPGGYNDSERGWTGGYATCSSTTDAVYLNCEFVILEGPYAKRKIWSLIGLHSPKGPEWANIGRGFIRAILNSARGFTEADNSPQAVSARRINSFADLDGIEFTAKIDLEKNKENEQMRNVIKIAIPKDHKDYNKCGQAAASQTTSSGSANSAVPSWAR